ncbi:MAG: NAD(P)/FAD-dependent oxidoreductase [Planctomycetota bacterium]|jgi:FADH2 O2-dependent halogenase
MNETLRADVTILGGGFGGSLLAMILARQGMTCVLLERETHPRFAIGESSTPTADIILKDLVETYDLPHIKPLTCYGDWKRAYPQIGCGCKRGFSYFQQHDDQQFIPNERHDNELLVAANPDSSAADTHWYRPDVDAFLFREAGDRGAICRDQAVVVEANHPGEWLLTAERPGEQFDIRTTFVVDATGAGHAMAQLAGTEPAAPSFKTCSRSLFAHFEGVTPWEQVYRAAGGRSQDHPFPCDAAALHHVFKGGWMWLLRFDNGITSAGFTLDMGVHPAPADLAPQDEWSTWISRFPSVASCFDDARMITPVRRTGRLQRSHHETVGDDWAMLPSTAYFLDPFYSSGIAHNLTGVRRLARILLSRQSVTTRRLALDQYAKSLKREMELLDLLIHGAYLTMGDMTVLAPFSMLYFLGATYSEHQRRQDPDFAGGFINLLDDDFAALIRQGYALIEQEGLDMTTLAELGRPFNVAGLCQPGKRNMYDYI